MIRRTWTFWTILSVVCWCGAVNADETKKTSKIRFEKKQLDPVFRSEGVAVGDFNKDGKKDIAAGYVWYEAPDWKMHCVIDKVPAHDPKGYSNSFCTWTEDLNGDGWLDLIVVDFPGTPTWWFENPKNQSEQWKRHTLTPVTNNESPAFVDLDGDGKRELVSGFNPAAKGAADSDGPDRRMGFAKPDKDAAALWAFHAVSPKSAPATMKYSHGLGVGDINGDKRQDIVCPEGWWEAPENRTSGEWKFHPADLGKQGAHLLVYDYDGDGDADVIGSSPHAFGLWWFEQLPDEKWQRHEIDMTFSQIHGLCLADINGDGLADFVCGKRWWAHAAGDPGVNDPAVFSWFELRRENGKPVWTKHEFDRDSGVGTQFEVADVDGDGCLDIISSNKKGVHLFRQVRE